MQEAKTAASTRTILSELIEPGDANYLGKAFGGAILAKIDLCAYATASRFAGTICVTVLRTLYFTRSASSSRSKAA